MINYTQARSALFAFSILAVAAAASSLPAEAGRRYAKTPDYVVAYSRFGNAKAVGRVRWKRDGRQVRLPGGTWIDCGRSCKETLRLNTVDFWQGPQGSGPDNAMTDSPGIFGDLTIIFGY